MSARGTRGATRADVAEAAAALNDADEQLVELVARLPLAPLAVLTTFLNDGTSTAQRRLRSMLDGGLVGAVASPLRTNGRPARLLWATDLGLTVLARRSGTDCTAVTRQLALRGAIANRLGAELPGLLAAYELLGLLTAADPSPVTLEAWERPWRRLIPARAGTAGAGTRTVRLPAAATLAWHRADGSLTRRFLLVPDTGGLALPALRATFGRLAEHQAVATTRVILVIATTTPCRARAWVALLETVCQARHLPLITAHVTTWANLRQSARAPDQEQRRKDSLLATERLPLPVGELAGWAIDTRSTILSRTPLNDTELSRVGRSRSVAEPGPVLGPMDRAVLDLVGRHPFLPTGTLAAVLGCSSRSARTRAAVLIAKGLLRVLPAGEVDPPALSRLGLLELTRAGLRVLSAHFGLSPAAAVRHHGLAGGGSAAPVGARTTLLGQLPHTLGANEVFAALAQAALGQPGSGALLEWRGAAACAHGRLRPDGYGLLRLGQERHGFFIEFDRGTMRPSRLRAKFAAYHRYRNSARAARAYAGFPDILVVTTGPGAEERIARAAREAAVGQPGPLRIVLTTTSWMEAHPEGLLGPIWRSPASTRRGRWPVPPRARTAQV